MPRSCLGPAPASLPSPVTDWGSRQAGAPLGEEASTPGGEGGGHLLEDPGLACEQG